MKYEKKYIVVQVYTTKTGEIEYRFYCGDNDIYIKGQAVIVDLETAKKVVKERYDWIKNFKTKKQYRIFIARAHVSQLKLTNGDLLVYDYICENKKFVNCAVL